jgi:solute carrier family 25 (adenine nucleotide translocator) protein 4/5/6/31
VNIIRYFPTQALNFPFKDAFAHYFNAGNTNLSKLRLFFNNIISGGFAGSLTTLLLYPLDLARTRLGVDLGKNKEQR